MKKICILYFANINCLTINYCKHLFYSKIINTQQHRKNDTKDENNDQKTYSITILGQKEYFTIFFTKGISLKQDSNLGEILSNYPNDFGLTKSLAFGYYLTRVSKVTLPNNKEAYFSIQSGDNNQKNAANIHPDCNQYKNNACSVGLDWLKLVPNMNYVFRFVVTKINPSSIT